MWTASRGAVGSTFRTTSRRGGGSELCKRRRGPCCCRIVLAGWAEGRETQALWTWGSLVSDLPFLVRDLDGLGSGHGSRLARLAGRRRRGSRWCASCGTGTGSPIAQWRWTSTAFRWRSVTRSSMSSRSAGTRSTLQRPGRVAVVRAHASCAHRDERFEHVSQELCEASLLEWRPASFREPGGWNSSRWSSSSLVAVCGSSRPRREPHRGRCGPAELRSAQAGPLSTKLGRARPPAALDRPTRIAVDLRGALPRVRPYAQPLSRPLIPGPGPATSPRPPRRRRAGGGGEHSRARRV